MEMLFLSKYKVETLMSNKIDKSYLQCQKLPYPVRYKNQKNWGEKFK